MNHFLITLEQDPKGFELIPIYDTHFGARAHRKDRFQRVLNRIKETGAYFFLGGDLAEFIGWKDRRFEPDTIDPMFISNLDKFIDYSIDYIIDTFYPVRDRCLFIISGNHDQKLYKTYGVDIIRRIAEGLEVKHWTRSLEALVRISFRTPNHTWTFNLYAHHGFGGGRKKGGQLNNLEDLAGYYEADIYVLGHSHQLITSTKRVLTLNKTGTGIIEKEKVLVRVGGFRDSRSVAPSYEEKAGLYPNALGTVIIKADKAGRKQERLSFTVEMLTGG